MSEKVRVQLFKMELITDFFFQIPNHLFSGEWEENCRGWFTLNGKHYYGSDAVEYINVYPVVRLLLNHVLKRADLHKNKRAIVHLFTVVYLLQKHRDIFCGLQTLFYKRAFLCWLKNFAEEISQTPFEVQRDCFEKMLSFISDK